MPGHATINAPSVRALADYFATLPPHATIKATHKKLADATHLPLRTLARALHILLKSGAIGGERGHWRILNSAILATFNVAHHPPPEPQAAFRVANVADIAALLEPLTSTIQALRSDVEGLHAEVAELRAGVANFPSSLASSAIHSANFQPPGSKTIARADAGAVAKVEPSTTRNVETPDLDALTLLSQLVARAGSKKAAAKLLGISDRSVRRALDDQNVPKQMIPKILHTMHL